MIDTHCHLNDARYRPGHLPEVLARAQAVGIDRMVSVGCDLRSSEACVNLAASHPGVVYASVGVHPHEARHWSDDAAERLRSLAGAPGVVAYGEVGLDFHYNHSEPDVQRLALREQIALAGDLRLPLIIHCRDAYDEMLPLVEAWIAEGRTAIMHCWAGTPEQARRYADAGAYLGFGGMVTFKSADGIRQACAEAPDSGILLETDAPWLSPAPNRGDRNEPARVQRIAEAVAELRGTATETVATLTTANAEAAYPAMVSGKRSAT